MHVFVSIEAHKVHNLERLPYYLHVTESKIYKIKCFFVCVCMFWKSWKIISALHILHFHFKYEVDKAGQKHNNWAILVPNVALRHSNDCFTLLQIV